MKIKLYLLLFLLLGTIDIQAQKIKVKKGDILVDKIKFGHIEKVKIKNDSIKETFYKVTDNNGEHVFNFRSEYAKSLLLVNDKSYYYYTIEYVKDKKRAAVQNPKYYPSEKQMAKYLITNNLLNKEGENIEAVSKLITNKGLLPKNILEIITAEKETLSYAKFKVDRVLTDKVYVFFDKTTSGESDFRFRDLAVKSRYNIYQGVKDPKTNEFISKTFIGYAKVEWKSQEQINSKSRPNPKGRYSLVVYNTKHVPMASYLFITYKTYHPYKEFGPTKTKISKTETVTARIKYMVNDLLHKKMI
ncbi:hypothetical protein SAMN05444411_103257 [Lutibacter oricola]|uniref:Uncharacterized protein n=1 Tax=Lutibacter oricola TaxID=762486 RepID=A0A1H2ZHI5_9FLAO|nr:hypothetical protein [Lutibacter oricola]SDX16900.1 hypothetical protein SAMN05444411_103257 [Lutibacter oricola]